MSKHSHRESVAPSVDRVLRWIRARAYIAVTPIAADDPQLPVGAPWYSSSATSTPYLVRGDALGRLYGRIMRGMSQPLDAALDDVYREYGDQQQAPSPVALFWTLRPPMPVHQPDTHIGEFVEFPNPGDTVLLLKYRGDGTQFPVTTRDPLLSQTKVPSVWTVLTMDAASIRYPARVALALMQRLPTRH
jgi:hypothetical protein